GVHWRRPCGPAGAAAGGLSHRRGQRGSDGAGSRALGVDTARRLWSRARARGVPAAGPGRVGHSGRTVYGEGRSVTPRAPEQERRRPSRIDADPETLVAEARRVLKMEADAVAALADRVGDSFVAAVEAVMESRGRVIVSGVGKSRLVGRTIATRLTSTGTPATVLHPVEALHGDLGIVDPGDVAILLSKSGESEELHGLLEYFRRVGVVIVAISGRSDSTL